MIRSATAILLVAIGYAVVGQMSFTLSVPAGYASIIWPPAGMALAAVLLLGYRAWVGVFLGCLLVNLWRIIDAHGWALSANAVLVPIGIGLGAAAQAVFGTWLVRRYIGSPGPLDTARDIVCFLLLGGAAGCVVNSIWGPLVLLAAGIIPPDALLLDMGVWWVGDVLGAVIVAPLLFTLGARPREIWRRRRLSLGIPLIGVLVLALALFILASARERDRLDGQFRQAAARIADDLVLHVHARLNSIRAVANVLHVYRADDERMSLPFTNAADHPLEPASGVRMLQWVPAIAHGEPGTGSPAEQDTGGAFYYPLRFPGRQGAAAVELDLGTTPEGLAAIRGARDTGRATLTAPMELALPDGGQRGLVALLPVYAEAMGEGHVVGHGHVSREPPSPASMARRRHSLRGFVAGVILVDELIPEALSHTAIDGLTLRILDITSPESSRLVFAREEHEPLNPSFQARVSRLVGERRLRVELTPTMTMLRQTRSWQAPVIWVAGLLVATLLGALLLLATGHTARVEAQAAEQADALTKIKAAQAELKRRTTELEHYKVIVNSAPASIFAKEYSDERQGVYILANPTCNEVLGKDSIAGHTDDELLPADLAATLREHDHKVLEGGEPILVEEIVADARTGKRIHALATKVPLRDADGHSYGVAGIALDITEQKQLTQRLAALNEELKEFAYVASHDLQEPLRTVRSFVELLERRYGDAFDERGRQWLEFIVSGTQRMRDLIDDLLAYSRVGRTGKVVPVDTARLMSEILDDARASIEAAGAVVEVGEMPVVPANVTELRQVFQNLVSNALKFRRPDVAPRVTIAAERTPEGWSFSVSDNGIGIEPAYHERIFQVFQRLHGRDEYPGTGIGLALVKKIIERQGGRIAVRSTAGEGTTFEFTVPAGAGAMPAGKARGEEASLPAGM